MDRSILSNSSNMLMCMGTPRCIDPLAIDIASILTDQIPPMVGQAATVLLDLYDVEFLELAISATNSGPSATVKAHVLIVLVSPTQRLAFASVKPSTDKAQSLV